MKSMKFLIIAVMLAFVCVAVFSRLYLNSKTSSGGKGEEEERKGGEGQVELSKESQELINLETAKVGVSVLKKTIPVIGQIAQDTENVVHVISPQQGVITARKVEIGSTVKKDDVICLVKTDEAVAEVRSPISGMVIGDSMKTGEKVDNVSSICSIADLSKLWANFDVYEKDIGDIKMGQKVIARSIAYPDKTFDGKIVFISPRVDESSHTIKIRALVDNKDYSLKLGMFIGGEIVSESEEKYLSVPSHAVQTMGSDKVVFIKTGDNKFDLKKVKVKAETKDEVFIDVSTSQDENGQVKEGDEVVIESAFLLKSELLKGELEE